jgi:hypothetical protein
MAEQQWEYCELGLEDWRDHKAGLLGGRLVGATVGILDFTPLMATSCIPGFQNSTHHRL